MMRLLVAGLAVAVALLSAPIALGAPPSVDVYTIDESFTPPLLSATCGFNVTRHVEGTLVVRAFFKDGEFVRELDQYHLVEMLTANDQTLIGRTTQNIQVTLFDDGSYTVAFMGTDFRVPVPGSGISLGSVGRYVLLYAADNTLLSVEQDVGNVQADYDALCEALRG